MNNFSRRSLMASLSMVGASLLGSHSIVNAARSGGMPVDEEREIVQPMTPSARKAAAAGLLAYFSRTVPRLLRPAGGILRHPSISPTLPGAAYNTQLWDWDTYWTSLGLFRTSHLLGDRGLHEKIGRHAQGSLLNFLDHQSEDGRIPIMIGVDKADPLGFVKNGGGGKNNQAKPVFGQLALLIADEIGDLQWLAPRFDQLISFYDSWTRGNRSSIGLLVWGDDVAIGDDNDPTTFGRPFFSSANLLLNCLYYQDLLAAAKLAHRLNRPQDKKRLSDQAREHGEQIQKYCWDPRDRFYYTVDVQCVDRRAELIPNVQPGMPMSWKCLPIKIQMFTGFLPLWCGLATREQAEYLVKLHYLNDRTFHSPSGVRSLSAQEGMYSLVRSGNPSNWLGPVWIIVNYLVWKGLKANGFQVEANILADKTLRLLASDLAKTGALNEYYDPDTGAPLSHAGFLDWNLLVTEML